MRLYTLSDDKVMWPHHYTFKTQALTSVKVDNKGSSRWKTSKTLTGDGGGKLVGQLMKNLQPFEGLVEENRNI